VTDNIDNQYLTIVRRVLETGFKKENRTGVDTIALPFQTISYDMSLGFPLLTTRAIPFKSVRVELEGFLNGITDKQWYKSRGCHFWDQWCNPTSWDVKYGGKKPDEVDDLGPIYGYQWVNWNYAGKNGEYANQNGGSGILVDWTKNQIKDIVDKLKNSPSDRRMICSAWNPDQLNYMALPPCHLLWQTTVIGGKVHLTWFQRSCDLALGVPSNIASYALLLLLLSKEAGLAAGTLNGVLNDCHVYDNHVDGLKEQLTREPRSAPTVEITSNSIWNWTHEHVRIEKYHPHPKIAMGSVAV
jgi:thymidylate synthase